MWRKIIITSFLLLPVWSSQAQSAEDMEKILRLTGYESPEDLDAYEVERLSSFIERPLKINVASQSVLRSSGLFSSYQTASLLDYRLRHGDIMSCGELSSVDGFTESSVQKLAPFISLEGGDIVRSRDGYVINDLAFRAGCKTADMKMTGGYGLKYRCKAGETLSLSLAVSQTYAGSLGIPDLFSGSLVWEPQRRSFRLIAGDFNARFGQGLALWNGMSMNGLSKVSSYMRTSSGLSSSWSFTGSSAHTGIAGEYSFSRFRISAFLSLPEDKSKDMSWLPAVNIGWYGRNMSVSVTHYMEFMSSASGEVPLYLPDMKTSADMAMCIDGTDLFSEVAFDWVNMKVAALYGVIFPVGEDVRIASHLRYYPAGFNPVRSAAPSTVSKCTNEYGVSVSSDYMPRAGRFSGSLSLDSAFLPQGKDGQRHSIHVRMIADGEIRIYDGLTMKVRLSERIRTWGLPFKTDLRTDLVWSSGGFTITGRYNILKYVGTGNLGFIEGGYKNERFSVYLKQLVFDIDNWDDRIYAYERDAPGSFSVPAFYGRGMNTSFMASWRFSRWGRLYAKGTFTYGQKKKSGKAGLKLQCVFSF